MKNYLLLLFIFTTMLSGCNSNNHLSVNEKIATNYLNEKGYTILTNEGEGTEVFTTSDLLGLPGEQIWAVQSTPPDAYLNKEIHTVKLTVKNHPLDHLFKMGKTQVTVFIHEGKVIGGWSFPISKEDALDGAPYSIDGKTLEEIHGDFQKWKEEWENKYKY